MTIDYALLFQSHAEECVVYPLSSGMALFSMLVRVIV